MATVPRVGKSEVLSTKNELCVAIAAVHNGTKSWVVLLHGHRTPSIRGGLQLVQEEVMRLKDSECAALEPEYNEDSTIKEFKAPARSDFSIDDKVSFQSSSEIPAPADVHSEKGVEH